MAAMDAEDFASYMHDWGEAFSHRGLAFQADYSDPPGEAAGTRGTMPTMLVFQEDAPDLAVGSAVLRKATDTNFEVVDIWLDSTALDRPAWRVKLNAS